MRGRVARWLRALATRIDGPPAIVINYGSKTETAEMAALREEWVRKYGAEAKRNSGPCTVRTGR